MPPFKHKSNRYCSVPQCKSRCTNEITLFSFPRDEKLQEKWAEALKIQKNISKHMNVCSLHFVKHDFILPHIPRKPLHLKKGAIPSQNVPEIWTQAKPTIEELRENEADPLENNSFEIEEITIEPQVELNESSEETKLAGGSTPFIILDQPSTSNIPDELHDSSITDKKIDYANSSIIYSIEESFAASIEENSIQTEDLNEFNADILDLSFLQEFPNLEEITSSNKMDQIIHGCVLSKFSKLRALLGKEKNKIKILHSLSETGEFQFIDNHLKKITKEFINFQISNIEWGSYVKNWNTIQEKLARSIYKTSPLVYNYLYKYFDLPAKTILISPSKTYFDKGMNNTFINHLSTQVGKLFGSERYCLLLIGDMPLSSNSSPETPEVTEHIIYGHEESDELPERCLVFMAKGIQKKWQQIVAYFFINPSVSTIILKQLIFEVIQELQKIDLKVVATVCNQESKNYAILEELIEEDTHEFTYLFDVKNQPICVIYDVPHLLKTTRNALQKCLCQFEGKKHANFDFIERAFDLDQLRQFKTLLKLKKEYFNFEDDEIVTDVKVAARQLSYSVAVSIESWQASKRLPPEAIYTAQFAYKMDCLFDSLNGSNTPVSSEKHLKDVLKKGSPHITLWSQMLREMKSWRLIDKKDGTDVTNQYDFIKGWQTTMKSIVFLWDTLGKRGFKHFCLRSFNQEPLDNLLRYIREHTGEVTPDGDQFIIALENAIKYKTLLGNVNCEEDGYENLYHVSYSRKKVNQELSKTKKKTLYSIEK